MSHLDIWTVYDHPTDFPDCFVARKANVTAETYNNGTDGFTDEYVTGTCLEEVRTKIQDAMPYVLTCMARHPEDDPVIVECWL